jgi:predicted transcriptional regulator
LNQLSLPELKRKNAMSDHTALHVPLTQLQVEEIRWLETILSINAATQGRVVSAELVHDWMRSWGSEEEKSAEVSVLKNYT